jgi:hypothetical protein
MSRVLSVCNISERYAAAKSLQSQQSSFTLGSSSSSNRGNSSGISGHTIATSASVCPQTIGGPHDWTALGTCRACHAPKVTTASSASTVFRVGGGGVGIFPGMLQPSSTSTFATAATAAFASSLDEELPASLQRTGSIADEAKEDSAAAAEGKSRRQ